ncbi:MAG: hypothetical protein J5950_09010 [Clostridia bacterium]|nr:hypothetical protein [Clostridia bacterium]
MNRSENRSKIFRLLAGVLLLALILTASGISAYAAESAPSETVIEFEDMEFDTEDTLPSFNKPYVHEALPVEAGVEFNVYDAGLSLLCEFEVEEAGSYRVYMDFIMNYNHGVFDVSIDGTKCAEPVNFNNGGGWQLSTKQLGSFDLSKGTHTLAITGTDTDYYQGILDCLRLRKIDKNSPETVFEFAGEEYEKSSNYFLENPFPRELPLDSAIWVDFGKADEYFTCSLYIPAAGKYAVSLSFILNNDSGSIRIECDDIVIAESVDLYHDGGWEPSVAELGEHEFTKGGHELKITLVESASGQTHAWLHQLIFKGIDIVQTTDEPATPTEQPATQAPTKKPAATDEPAATDAPADRTEPASVTADASEGTDDAKKDAGKGGKAGLIIGICAGALAIAAVVAVILIKKRKA